MHRARSAERELSARELRGAAAAAPRATPLTLVSAAVAGDGLSGVAASAATGAGCTVAIVLPGHPKGFVVRPEGAIDEAGADELLAHVTSVVAGGPATTDWGEAIPVRIGAEVVGLVLALGEPAGVAERRAWLEAAAAAASVAAVLEDGSEAAVAGARRAFLLAMVASPPSDGGAVIAQGQRLGVDLSAGATAICAQVGDEDGSLLDTPGIISAEVAEGRVLGLVPLTPAGDAEAVLEPLRSRGLPVAASLPQRDPVLLHEALREAELMLGLVCEPERLADAQLDTYRLLIRVLLRDPDELEKLRTHTVSTLERYDADHDTELLATLRCFLDHHGSTTETAEAMSLHRHTVGYRLSRVLEVSGLSPYESDGRERLSLGLKAHRIISADRRRQTP